MKKQNYPFEILGSFIAIAYWRKYVCCSYEITDREVLNDINKSLEISNKELDFSLVPSISITNKKTQKER